MNQDYNKRCQKPQFKKEQAAISSPRSHRNDIIATIWPPRYHRHDLTTTISLPRSYCHDLTTTLKEKKVNLLPPPTSSVQKWSTKKVHSSSWESWQFAIRWVRMHTLLSSTWPVRTPYQSFIQYTIYIYIYTIYTVYKHTHSIINL